MMSVYREMAESILLLGLHEFQVLGVRAALLFAWLMRDLPVDFRRFAFTLRITMLTESVVCKGLESLVLQSQNAPFLLFSGSSLMTGACHLL